MPLDLAIRATLLLVLARSALNALEVLGSLADYRPSGALSWPCLSLERSWTRQGRLARPLDALLGSPGFFVLNICQLALVILLALSALFAPRLQPGVAEATGQIAQSALLLLLLTLELLADLRNRTLGRDGSDRMHLVVLTAITVCCTFTDPRARAIPVGFLAVQVMLAYFTSGVVKALAPRWRSGEAFRIVLMSENYGCRPLGNLVTKWPSLGQISGWSVILFELGFPFVVLLGPRPALLLLILGLGFHFGVAAAMGLNGFVWSFAATYPAVFWLSTKIHGHLS